MSSLLLCASVVKSTGQSCSRRNKYLFEGNRYCGTHHNVMLRNRPKTILEAIAPANCMICFCDIHNHCVDLPCAHTYCDDCMATYVNSVGFQSPDLDECGRMRCPSCKVEKGLVEAFISDSSINALLIGGFINQECVNRLLMINLATVCGDTLYECCGGRPFGDQRCENIFTVDTTGGMHNSDSYKVSCTLCNVVQCVNCNVVWDGRHTGRNCAAYQRAIKPFDNETQEYFTTHGVIPCPGKCGHGLQKESDVGYCNVLKCLQDKIYVCALCGLSLNSKEFDKNDNNHNLANEHDWNPQSTCYQALFKSRVEWLGVIQP